MYFSAMSLFQRHDYDSTDEDRKVRQFLHHICERSPLRGIANFRHLHVVRARQDEMCFA